MNTRVSSMVIFPGLLVSALATAHGPQPPTHAEGLTLAAGLAATYRSDIAETNRLWQIPGRLMGGEAETSESGFALDEASLAADFSHSSGVIARAELAAHHGSTVDLEQGWAGYRGGWGEQDRRSWQVAAGRIKAAFSPQMARHASEREFSENRLLDDAFYGGHYQDDGLQAVVAIDAWTAGVELWGGEHYPSTSGSGGGAQDLFAYWSGQRGDWLWRLGGWAYHARADDRQDDRLESGHSHSGNILQTNDNPVLFDGDERHLGLHADLSFVMSSGLSWHLAAEFIQAAVDGDLRDTTRTAILDGDYRGFWVQPAVSWDGGRQHLAFRYERLALDNHLSGSAATILAESSGLQNSGNDPLRYGLSFRFYPVQRSAGAGAWHRLGLRLEWIHRDDGIDEDPDEDYIGVGLVFAAEDRFSWQ